jgi:hypothetical protein
MLSNDVSHLRGHAAGFCDSEHGIAFVLMYPASAHLHAGERPSLECPNPSSRNITRLEDANSTSLCMCVQIVSGPQARHARSENEKVRIVVV